LVGECRKNIARALYKRSYGKMKHSQRGKRRSKKEEEEKRFEPKRPEKQ